MKEVQLLANKAEESQGGWQGVLKAATSGVAYLDCVETQELVESILIFPVQMQKHRKTNFTQRPTDRV